LKTVKRAKELGAIGIKDSSAGNIVLFLLTVYEAFKEEAPEFSIICRDGKCFYQRLYYMVGHGAVAAWGKFLARDIFVDLYNASWKTTLEDIKDCVTRLPLLNSTNLLCR